MKGGEAGRALLLLVLCDVAADDFSTDIYNGADVAHAGPELIVAGTLCQWGECLMDGV